MRWNPLRQHLHFEVFISFIEIELNFNEHKLKLSVVYFCFSFLSQLLTSHVCWATSALMVENVSQWKKKANEKPRWFYFFKRYLNLRMGGKHCILRGKGWFWDYGKHRLRDARFDAERKLWPRVSLTQNNLLLFFDALFLLFVHLLSLLIHFSLLFNY